MRIDTATKPARVCADGCYLSVALIGAFLTACSDEPVAQAQAATPTSTAQTAKAATLTDTRRGSSATLTLGETDYGFDFVMCAPGAGGTTMVIASDNAKRPEYPMVRASVFPDQPPESVANTMSVDFSNATPRVLWLLDTGLIQKTDDGLAASGDLKGSEMVRQAGGNQKPVPLATNGHKSFRFDVRCR